MEMFKDLPLPLIGVAGITILTLYLLPSILAFFLNRASFGKIFAVNLVAGFSWVAWIAVLVWAATGKGHDKVAHLKFPWAWPASILGLIAVTLLWRQF